MFAVSQSDAPPVPLHSRTLRLSVAGNPLPSTVTESPSLSALLGVAVMFGPNEIEAVAYATWEMSLAAMVHSVPPTTQPPSPKVPVWVVNAVEKVPSPPTVAVARLEMSQSLSPAVPLHSST